MIVGKIYKPRCKIPFSHRDSVNLGATYYLRISTGIEYFSRKNTVSKNKMPQKNISSHMRQARF